ncbi:MAG: hypothetical protein GX552_17495 [Chloroflexi bacterium]|nr:hypothetical protein [Chloroflexota bacterium]
MRHRIAVLVVCLLALAALGHLSTATASTPPWLVVDQPANLLANPDFEGDFPARHDPYTGVWAGELGVAEEWDLWYVNDHSCPPYDPGCDPLSYNRRPEYKGEEGTFRVASGKKSQKFFTSNGTHQAGFFQTVEVPPNSWVRFSIWVMAWSSDEDVPEHSFKDGDYALSIGIDPTGGTDWRSEHIIWGPETTRHDEWVHLTLDAYTESGQVSVWTRGAPVWPVKHNDSYWDDASLIVLSSQPQPTPTDTPTSTPYPTPEPTPDGYEPPACDEWRTVWADAFDQPALTSWGQDPAAGRVAVESGAMWLRNGASAYKAFPLAWSEHLWPGGDLRLSFRFAYDNLTGYGSTIGVGSQSYDGERSLAGSPDPYGIEDILSIHHRESSFYIRLLGKTVWTGTPGDESWHSVQLELRESTYILTVDGTEVGRGVSYWRPRSLYVGNPVITWIWGKWSEVALDDVQLEQCGGSHLHLPLVMREHLMPEPSPETTIPPAPANEQPAPAETPISRPRADR